MQYQVITLHTIAILNAVFSLIILRGEKTLINRIFSVFVLSASAWAVGLGFFITTPSLSSALLLANFYYVSAALIPALFFIFSLSFLRKTPPSKLKVFLILLPPIILTLLFLYDKNFILGRIFYEDWGKNVLINQTNYLIYELYFIVYVLISFYKLFQHLLATVKKNEKLQLKLVIFGTLIPYILGMYFNLILPWLGNYRLIWLGPIFSAIMVAVIGYAIVRHRLFNLKVVATEVFVFALWVFIIIRILLANNLYDQLIDGVLLLATFAIGILLIRAVIKEVQTRERIQLLAEELAAANERLRELDRQKSEFVSIASHQLRSPLTAIKGYSSMILENSFGDVSAKLRDPIEKIFQSSERLVIIIEDFLNISRIEQGRMQYEFSTVDLGELVKGVVEELGATAKRAGLYLEYNYDKLKAPYNITADLGKIRQVVANVIDNAIKYTPKGGITLIIHKDEDTRKVLLEIKDTGIGIPLEVMPRLFEKFSRAEGASKTNIQGTGLGLYVAKEIMKAHKGSIWVDSDGKDRGSTFYLEFLAE